MAAIRFPAFVGKWYSRVKDFYIVDSGGKKTVSMARVGITAVILFLFSLISVAWLGPKEDFTYYNQTSEPQTKAPVEDLGLNPDPGQMTGLFSHGEKEMQQSVRTEKEKKKIRIVLKYSAPQIIGAPSQESKAIKMGSKLLGFLKTPIDTREPSLVRVQIPHGGESSNMEIEKGSILLGTYSYSGDSNKVYISFSQINAPDGESKKIAATALDAQDYTAGVRGEEFSGAGIKLAAQLGLTMFAGMTDVLTEKEALGNSFGADAKPTMKNALLQGASRAAQDQAGRTSSEIESVPDYVIVPEGKEMIIQLTEDFKNEGTEK